MPLDGDDRPPPQRGVLERLCGIAAQDVKRTITRLHRNLGHPTSGELMKLLEQKGASAEMIGVPSFTSAQRAKCTSDPLANLFLPCPEPHSSTIEFKLTRYGFTCLAARS